MLFISTAYPLTIFLLTQEIKQCSFSVYRLWDCFGLSTGHSPVAVSPIFQPLSVQIQNREVQLCMMLLIPQVILLLQCHLYGLGTNHPKKRDGGKRHPGKSLRKKRVPETRGIQIGVKRLMCEYNVKVSTCCRWEGYYKLEPELFGGVR